MNFKQILALWIVAILLIAGIVVIKSRQSSVTSSHTDRKPGETVLADFPEETVDSIRIESAGESTLLKKSDGTWTVENRDGYPARTAAVNSLLRTINELKVSQSIEAGTSFAPRFGIDPEASGAARKGTFLSFETVAGETVARLALGNEITPEASLADQFGAIGAGRYVMNPADESGFYAVKETFPALVATPSGWLDQGFLQISGIQSIAITEPGKPDLAWKLFRPDAAASFALEGAAEEESLDPTATNPLKDLFSFARFQDIVPLAEIATRGDAAQTRHLTIETFDGFAYAITLVPEISQDPAAADPADGFLMSFEVTANLAESREPAPDETPEAAKSADEAFAKAQASLNERLERESKLVGHTYLMDRYTIAPLLKSRAELLATPDSADAGIDPGFSPDPPYSGPMARPEEPDLGGAIEAVTPPIEVPALEEPPVEE